MFDGRPEEFAVAVADPTSWELEAWLSCLPANLGNVGLVEEAVALGDALAVLDPVNAAMYAGDVASVLAEAGRMAEAEARFAAALETYPDDEWVRIEVARTFVAAGDLDGAERHLRDAVTVSRRATDPYKTDDASEELAAFLEQHGRQEQKDRQAGPISVGLRTLRTRPTGRVLRAYARLLCDCYPERSGRPG